ncbi:MAG: hypothetical protein ACOYM3_08580 [Terrimicrobiaceae bacterium]
MNTNPLIPSALIEDSNCPVVITRGMLRERAVELALINGRSAYEASCADWEQAKLELGGQA